MSITFCEKSCSTHGIVLHIAYNIGVRVVRAEAMHSYSSQMKK